MKQKLIALSSLLLVTSLIIGLVGLRGTNAVNNAADKMYQQELLGLSHIKEANVNLIYLQRTVRSILLTQTDSRLDQNVYKTKLSLFKQQFKNELNQAKNLFYTDEGKMKIVELEANFKEYESILDESLNLAENEEAKGLNTVNCDSVFLLFDKGTPFSTKVDTLLSELAIAKEQNAKIASENTTHIYNVAKWQMIALVLFGMVTGSATTWFVIRQIMTAVTTAQKASLAIANGDLSSVIENSSNDELGIMLASIKTMQNNLIQLVTEIRQIVDNARRGDFSTKIRLSDKKGFGRDISESLTQSIKYGG